MLKTYAAKLEERQIEFLRRLTRDQDSQVELCARPLIFCSRSAKRSELEFIKRLQVP